ncbi:VOC family protein [Nocardia sp. NPDC101769]|uniref:VOC family protein n=1 Tax=Nocardia sp. NPDC101769 TaxID=3364333 RepID=UPI0037FE418C
MSLPAAIDFYTDLLGVPVRARLRNPAGTLDLVLIGSMLLIGGGTDALATRRDLEATYIVDDLTVWRGELRARGCTVIEEPTRGPMSGGKPVGTFMFVRHPDGRLFEYVQMDTEAVPAGH